MGDRRINLCPICCSQAAIEEREYVDRSHGGGRWPTFFVRCTNDDCAIRTPTYPKLYPKSKDKAADLLDALDHWNNLWNQKRDPDEN